MDVALAIVAMILGLVGIAGSVVPALPGPPVSWLGMLALSFTAWWERPVWFLVVWLGVTVAVTVADNLLPVAMTKRFGGSRAATIGTVVGMVVGMFFGPIGVIAGPFVGAFAGELAGNRSEGHVALRVAVGAFVAFICGVGLKLVASGAMMYHMVRELAT
jgi:uncharacterized protein YqgC (DUF456 family)